MANKITSWSYKPFNNKRAAYNYVGLKNLGCICYMNAMMQQFFMTKSFRYALMAANDKKLECITEYNGGRKEYKNKKIDDNVLH